LQTKLQTNCAAQNEGRIVSHWAAQTNIRIKELENHFTGTLPWVRILASTFRIADCNFFAF